MAKRTKWTTADLIAKGTKFTDTFGKKGEGIIQTKKYRKLKKATVEAKQLTEMKQILRIMKHDFKEEHRFHPVRRFKFDIALVEYKIAIEYEGLNSVKSGHTTALGYTKDCIKYNLATLCGWRVLRYTAIEDNYKNMMRDIIDLKKLIDGRV